MSNRSSSHQHGCHRIKRRQPSKIQRLKNNKAAARPRQTARNEAITEALAKVTR
jgi:hypothetical protein